MSGIATSGENEKKGDIFNTPPENGQNVDLENEKRRKSSVTLNGRRMSRIAPPPGMKMEEMNSDSGSGDEQAKLVEMEADNAIKYRTCSWQMTGALLFAEYISLAIMSFPYSYSVLGLVPGLILTVAQAAFVLYTSLIVWEFCLRHPEVRDVCDIGQMLFGNSKVAWYFTAVMFLLNNTFIQGLHVLTIARYLNTMSGHTMCTVAFAAFGAIVSWIASLPRTFSLLSYLATASAIFTFISVVLAAAFAGAEGKTGTGGFTLDPNVTPNGYPDVRAFPVPGTTFVSGLSAFLNIGYTFIGQITLPSFIAEMKNPMDFRKVLWMVTIAEILVFSVVGAVIYAYVGTQYMTAPAFGSLGNEIYKKISFSFMIPTLIFLGVLYASVSARFVFFRIFEGSRHKTSHTLIGWASWAGILGITWVFAFIVAEVIPFFSDLLSLMSSLFDSFFGWIFWGVAYIRMRRADLGPDFYKKRGIRGWVGLIVNVFIIIVGLFFLSAGTYVSVESIIIDYANGDVSGVFTCANTAL